LHLEKEVIKGKMEILLLKGTSNVNSIAAAVGIKWETADKYIEEIYVRWATLGNFAQMKQRRGRARARLELLASELWRQHSEASSTAIKNQALGLLLQVHDRQMILDNLTPKSIPLLTREDEDEGGSVGERIKQHGDMLRLVDALIAHIEGSHAGDAVNNGVSDDPV